MESVMLKKASIGQIVHFYSQTVADRSPSQPGNGFNGIGAGPYTAIVTQTFEDGDGVTYCNLKVFPPFSPPFDEGSVAERDSKHFQPGRYWEWPDLQANNPPAETPVTKALFIPTQFELTWGSDRGSSGARYFDAGENNDAAVRFAERVLELDGNPAVGGGWVHLKQLDGSGERFILGWTKTSNERPTAEGRPGA